MKRIDNAWQFTPKWSEAFLRGENEYEEIRIPHTVKECPLHYIDVDSYQMICGYRRHLNIQDLNKRYFLQFDGAAHIATVYVNGKEVTHHECGYTAFRIEITDALHKGDNLVSVKLNTTEDASIPPFGFMIDYLTYGGIYRHVWLDEKESTYIKDVFVQPLSDLTSITSTITYDGDTTDMHVKAQIFDQEHICVVQKEFESCLDTITQFIPSPILWNVHHAYLKQRIGFYNRNPFTSLIRDNIILQLQLITPGNGSMTVCKNASISSAEDATACTCNLSFPVTR